MASQTYEDICTHDTTTGLIECTHAQDQGCVRVEIQGKSEQVQSTQGKNLFNGVFHDGFIDLNTGVITSSPADPNSVYSDLIRLYSGKTYIVSGHDGGAMRYRLYNLDGSYAKNISSNGQYTSDGDYYVRLLWYQGLTDAQKTKIQLEEGSTATAYEPFTPNSPSPDYPSVINSVGDSGKLNVVSSVGRRNLIPNTNQGKTGWSYPHAAGGSFAIDDYSALGINAVKLICTAVAGGWGAYIFHTLNRNLLNNNTKYTLAFDVYSNVTGNHEAILMNQGAYNGLGNFGIFSTKANEWIHVELSCTTNSAKETDQVLYITNFNRIGEVIFANLQMVEGDSIDKYSPAPEDITPENFKQYEDKLSLATVNLTSPLRSLPNGIHDVLECKDEVWGVTRNVGKIVLNGSEAWALGYGLGDGKNNRFEHSITNLNLAKGGSRPTLCNCFKFDTAAGIPPTNHFRNTYAIEAKTSYMLFNPDTSIVAREDLNAWKQWIGQNNIAVLYENTPTWEPLDDSSQKALNNILSYSGKDYIYTTDSLATNFSVAVKSRACYENFKLQEEIKNTNTSLDDLDDEIKGGFYDGIINTNEAEAIRKAAETMHTQVTNQFNKVDSNPSLTGAPKTTHQTKYTECNNAYNTLISRINTAIEYCSVNSTKTDTQKKTAVADMNTAFGTYKTKLADYQKAYQDAIDAIAKKKADDAVDGVVIGGRNLFRQSGHWEKLPDTKYWGNNGGTLSLDTTVKYLGYNTLRTTVGSGIKGYFDDWIELDTNKTYTYSAIILTNANVTGNESTPLHYHCAVDKNNTTAGIKVIKFQQSAPANQWTLLYLTFKPRGKYWRPFVYIGSGNTIFNIAYLKLEEGTKVTDWTPNSEDTDEKITQVSATLTSTINEIEHTVDKNTKSITDKVWKSDIITGIKDLNVGGINLWDLSAIKRYASGSLNTIVAGTAVDAKTGKITVTADPQAVPGCKIDVSTLTRNSSNIGELVITGYFDRTDSDNNKLKNVYLYYRCFNNANAEIQAHTNKLVPVETSSNLFAGTLSIPANTTYINFGVGQIPYVKPYTLTGVTVKDSALYDITKGLRDQVSQAYQDINGFKQTVSDTYTTKTEFDQLSIGGRNLAVNDGVRTGGGNTIFDKSKYLESGTIVFDRKAILNGGIMFDHADIYEPSTKYVLRFKAKLNSGSITNIYFHNGQGLLNASIYLDGVKQVKGLSVAIDCNFLDKNYHEIIVYFTTPATLKDFTQSDNSTYWQPMKSDASATYNVTITELKIEKGTKFTDWTPPVEDVNAAIEKVDGKFTNYTTTTDMNSKFDQTKKAIELGVSQTYTSKAEGDKITQGLNKWILEVYQLTSSSMPNPRLADIENIRGKVPTKIVEVADTSTNININVGDYYIGHAFTYLYFDTAYTWSGTIMTDDEGAVYLNGVKKVSTAVRVFTNVTLPFQAGWNVLEIVYNEGGVDDGWLFSSKLSTLSQCKIMNCYAQVSLNASALIKVTADAISQKVENDAAYAEFTEQAGKIAWLVASGKDAASMQLTPEALNVIADKINLTGKVTFSSLATDAKKKIEEAKQAGTDAQESLNNLTIGGRNLLLDSGRVITTTTAYNVVNYGTSTLKPNTKYTFVINGFTNSGNSLGVWFNGGSDGGVRFPATTVAKTQYIMITTPSTLKYTLVNLFNYPQSTATSATINWACMYEGEIKPPLDWTPAPEDINDTISALGEDLQDQIDGKIESYNQTTNPADAWTTAAIKTQHTGDIWYNDSTKLTQRWSGTAWMPLKDADALAAQELAKQKKRVFTATPTTPYDVGDLWVQGGTGDIMKCKTALASGSYNAAHWEKASKYTDDTTANQAVSNTVLTPADKISLYATFLSIQNEYSRLKEQCTNLGVADTLKTSYDALYALLNGIVGTTTLQNSITSGFNKSNYDTLYKNYVTAREVLEQAQITKVYAYTKEVKETFTVEKALAVANWFAQQDKTMIDGAYIYTGTVTAKQIAANSIDTDRLAVGMNPNLVRYGLDTMEQFSTVPYFSKSATATVTLDDSQYYIGTKSIKFIGTSDSNSVCLGSKETDYGCVPVTSGKTYILSCYVKTTSTSNVNAFLGFVAHPDISASNIINHGNASKTLKNTDGWVRLSIKYTASSAYPYASIRINVESPSYPVWFDAFQIEEVDSEDKEPGTFKQAGTTIIDGGNITTGIMKSANYNYSSGNFTIAGTMIDLATGVIRSKGFGMDSSGNSYFNGTVTATTLTATANGNIAGWNINSYCLYRTSFTWGNSTGMYFGSSGLSVRDKFKVDASGNLTATSATINGNITATSGFIGNGSSGFTIKSTSIYNGMSSLSSAATGIYLGTDGISLGGGKFKVDKDGITTATSGIIGGWNITPDSMNRQFTANNKNYWLYFDTGTTSDAFAAFMLRTKATTASAWEDKFSIAWNGRMTAMDADVRGTITAMSGALSGFKIVSDKLYTEKTISGNTFESFVIKPNAPGTSGDPLMMVRSTLTGTPELIVTKDNVWIRKLIAKEIEPISGNISIGGGLDVDNVGVTGSITLGNHLVWRLNGGALDFAKMSNNESINMPYIANGSSSWTYNYLSVTPSIQSMTVGAGGNVLNLLGTVKENSLSLSDKYSPKSHLHSAINNGIYSWNISGTGNLIPRKNGTDTAANIGANSTTGCVNAVYYKSLVNKSDRRFKENIKDVTLKEALNIIENLRIKSYNYKDDKVKMKNYGILGQELRDLLIDSSQELFSALSIDEIYEEGRPVYDLKAKEDFVVYGVNYTQFIPLLIKAMQYVLQTISRE